MHSEIDRTARTAGGLYLLMVFTAPLTQFYLPAKLIVRGNAAATAANFVAHDTLAKLFVTADLLTHVTFIAIAIALYRLLARVDKRLAATMVALVLVSAAVGFSNVLNTIAALQLFRGGEFLRVFEKSQLEALGMFFLRLHNQGNTVDELFWGLWLFPFGILVMRSGFLPRFVGVWLIANGVAYVALSLVSQFAAATASLLFRFALPFLLGELVIAFWLVIKGAKTPSISYPSHLELEANPSSSSLT